MLSALAHTAQTAATRTAKTAVLGLAAGIALFVGIGFLTLAAWLLLVTVTTPLYAAVTLGSGFVGLALIMLAVISIRGRAGQRAVKATLATPPEPSGDILNQIVMTFLAGMAAGHKARS